MVSFGSILRSLQARVQVVVLKGSGLAELIQLQRQCQTLLVKLFGKMHFHDIEQSGASGLLGRVAAARADFQNGVHEPCVAHRAVGDAVVLTGHGTHAHAAGRKHRDPFDAQPRHELGQLSA
jgi:hypothetical protein